jgi:GPH family glycoside/pentoside/hexuronide:cation symporter
MNMANSLGLFRKLAYSTGYLGTTLIGELAVLWVTFLYAPLTVLMGAGEEWAGYAAGMMIGVALLFFPLINYLAKRLGKKTIYAASLLLFSILTSMLGTIGVFPFPPFYYGLFLIALAGISVSGFMVGSNAIIADVIDYDETITGFRREAIYFRKYPFQK